MTFAAPNPAGPRHAAWRRRRRWPAFFRLEDEPVLVAAGSDRAARTAELSLRPARGVLQAIAVDASQDKPPAAVAR